MSEEWMPYIVLGLGVFACIYAVRIIQTGRIEGDSGALSRQTSPVTFWFLFMFILLAGLGLAAAGVFLMGWSA
jgi:hypothetical protein